MPEKALRGGWSGNGRASTVEKRLVRSHHEVLHNMLDSGFRAAVNGIQREWSWWCGGPAGTGAWQGGWNKERFMRRMDWHGVPLEVRRDVVRWLGKGDRE